MAGDKSRPFVPPVQISDSLDKVNPGDIHPIQRWEKSIVPALIIYSGLLIFFVVLTILWVVFHSTPPASQMELTNNYIIMFFLLGIDAILLYGLFHAMRFMENKSKRETLVNLGQHQATMDQFTSQITAQMKQMMTLQERYMDTMLKRAEKSYYQGVLSVSDSHSMEGSNNPATTTVTEHPPEEKEEEKDSFGRNQDAITKN